VHDGPPVLGDEVVAKALKDDAVHAGRV
jgi:hypothetical protein